MILLVPITPEVPPRHRPRLWQGLILLLLLGSVFLIVQEILAEDAQYLASMPNAIETDPNGAPVLTAEGQRYLAMRPLAKIAPTKSSWDLARLITANFVHGSVSHLILNLIGVFAGARLCSTFIPFAATFSIFLVGGSVGLLASIAFSREISPHIPHVGASGGIFALMGTYYIFNFLYRTRYFFWLPRKYGNLNLRTKTFFFIDVILLELILSISHFMPDRVDTIDHIAHVVGFGVGGALAVLLKFFEQWPWFLQSRAEYLYWRVRPRAKNQSVIPFALHIWKSVLEINPYNDQVKIRMFQLVRQHDSELTDAEIASAIAHMSPTFIRLQTACVGQTLEHLMARGRPISNDWLARLPYDSLIRIAKWFTEPVERQAMLIQLLTSYRNVHPNSGDLSRKLELLSSRLETLIEEKRRANMAATG